MHTRDSVRLQPGAMMPHVDVVTLAGSRFAYQSIWQHRNLVLVTVTERSSVWERDYAAQVAGRSADFEARNCVCVATADPIPGLVAPAVLIADRWGEIMFVASAPASLPESNSLLDWADYLEQRCPECEGEAR